MHFILLCWAKKASLCFIKQFKKQQKHRGKIRPGECFFSVLHLMIHYILPPFFTHFYLGLEN